MNPRYAKGRRAEWRSRDLFKRDGFEVVRAAGSKGIDLVAWTETRGYLVSVKVGRWPSPAEARAFQRLPAPPGFRRLVHRWDHRKSVPQVRAI